MKACWKGLVAAAAILVVPVAARAHAFRCEKTVDGLPAGTPAHVHTYPTTVTYEWTIYNTHPTETSIVEGLVDSLFPTVPIMLPYPIPLGGWVSADMPLTIESYEHCVELANGTSNGAITLTNELTVFYDGTPQASCSAQVICHPPEVEACLTRTPGYWKNHPNVTGQFLPVESCGLELDAVMAGLQGSVTEDLCSPTGKDKKLFDSPQQAQLVRQCAAAALNASASAFFGGSCGDFAARYAECCSSCDTVAPGCIEDLDRFNDSWDTLRDDGHELELCHELGVPCSANPSACNTAAKNGFLNAR